MIRYEYLRPIKGKCLKNREEAEFSEMEVSFQIYNSSTVLPLRKSNQGELLFGQGASCIIQI